MNDFLFGILQWINGWIGSYGWAMVVFTVLIRLVLTPLDIKSRVSMRKTAKLQPQMQALQKKYANDKEKLNQKTAELYKKEHVNPLSSCLPLLLTWPILIAVFGAMRTAANFELLEQITDLLTYMGAVVASMNVMGTKALKQVRNIANRRANSEIANLQKTASASAAQIKAIKKLKRSGRYNLLPDELKVVAELRYEYPELTLRQLGEMLDPPISRSGVNHRLEKIIRFAEDEPVKEEHHE